MATEQPSLDSLCYNILNLQQLARQGSWRSLVDVIVQARKPLPRYPHEQLVYHAYLVLSHMKLRSYGDASVELDAVADLDSPQYQYQYYPKFYPQRTGSMVPFVLRWLHAELPFHLNQAALTFERLYALYDFCQRRIDHFLTCDQQDSGTHSPADSKDAASVDPRPAGTHSAVDSKDAASVDPQPAGTHSAVDSKDAANVDPQPAGTHSAVDSKDVKNVDPQLVGDDEGGAQDPTKGFSTSSTDDHPLANADPDTEFGDFVSGMTAAINEVEKPTGDGKLTSASIASILKQWRQRQEFIINCIICHHLNQRDFAVVFKWFKQLLHAHPSDPLLLSKLGYVQMQMGDLTGASYTFSEVENLVSKTEVGDSLQSSDLKGLVCRNKGLQHIVHKQYTEASKEFDAALSINPVDFLSANNKALCSMYNRDLIGSTKVLESILDKAPHVALNESLVLNLCSMYELAFVHNVQTKKNLSDWIQQIAPSDFDFSCTRL